MADIQVQHADITNDTYLHYPKGTASATADQLIVAGGDGTTSYKDASLTQSDEITLSYSSNQLMTTAGTTQNVVFTDTDTTSADGALTVAADGTITYNDDGWYVAHWQVTAGRSTSTGSSQLLLGVFSGSTQIGQTLEITLSDAYTDQLVPYESSELVYATAGTSVSVKMGLDAHDAGSAGLYASTLSTNTDFDSVASATLRMSKVNFTLA